MKINKILFWSLACTFIISCSSSKNVAQQESSDTEIPSTLSVSDQLLQLPGVTIVGNEVRIHGGTNSFYGSNAAAIEVNGQVIEGGVAGLERLISGNQIKSMRVLKAPSDLAIYGSRGMNGVIKIKLRNTYGSK